MQSSKLQLLTAATEQPLTAAALAAWIGCSTSDPLLEPLIGAAADVCEKTLGVALLTQTWRQKYDVVRAPDDWWDGVRDGPTVNVHRLPNMFAFARWPVQSVTHMKFFANDDSETVADAASYFFSAVSRPPMVGLRTGYTWPSIDYRVLDSVEAQFIAGYAGVGSIPAAIVNGIKAYAAFQYEHRGACDIDDALKNSGALGFWKPYKVMKT
jgi:uncharacterized phiE125 gp8 family phage protein